MTTEHSPTRTDLVALGVGLAILAALMIRNATFVHDDAFITLRYALNLAETGLIQWNPGEWVEGYTSILHVGLIAGVIRLGIDPLLAVHFVNVLASIGLLISTLAATRILCPGPEFTAARSLTVLAVAATAPIAIWAMGGLETVLVAAFLMAGLTCLLAGLQQSGYRMMALAALAFSGAILTRLDSAVFIAGCGLALLLVGPGSFRRRFGAAVLAAGIPATVSFIQMGLRVAIYDAAFPMTFYAKAGLPRPMRFRNGELYLLGSASVVPTIVLAVVIAPLVAFRRKVSAQATLIAIPLVLQLAYLLWVGGDHMPAARMLVPLIAPAAVLLLAFAKSVTPRASILPAIAFLLSCLAVFSNPGQKMDDAAFVGVIVGKHIDDTWPTGSTIALNTVGATSFFATQERNFIDMLGLNDAVIARREDVPILTPRQRVPGHFKGDGAYILTREPDRIIIGPTEGSDVQEPWFLSDVELAALPEFQRCYKKVTEEIPYSEDFADRGRRQPNPLIFTYYSRICD